MPETRYYDPVWMGQWRSDTGAYTGGGTPIRVGGGQGYYSLLGFPTQLLTDMQKSKTYPRVRLSIYVTDDAEFNIGVHKETYNKASNGLPLTRYAGLHPTLTKGRRYVDITNWSANTGEIGGTLQDSLERGWRGIVLFGDTGAGFGSAYGLTRNEYRVVIEVDGTWNQPPSTPKVTYPNGGETIAGKVLLRANPSTDPETASASLRYQWAIYDGAWNYLALGAAGETDLTVDFSRYRESSVAKVAVRAYDGQNYSPWDYSDGVFSIRRNVAPAMPTELKPAGGVGIDRSRIHEFSWRHNDTDTQSKFHLRWRLRGTTAWTTLSQETWEQRAFLNYYTFPAGTIEWQVQTFDQAQLASPWSEIAVFVSSEPADSPTILSPAQNQMIPEARPVVRWSSIDQREYEIELWNGNAVVWKDNRISTNKAITIGYDLNNNTSYQIRVRVKNSNGLWSQWALVDILTSFTPPREPVVSAHTDNERGSITIIIDNPYPANNEPQVSYNDLQRRKAGEEEWVTIAREIPVNGYFVDYGPASETQYEYRVIAWGRNRTFIETVPLTVTIAISQAILQLVSNPDKWVGLKWNPQKSFDYGVEAVQKQFDGRPSPLTEFGQGETLNMDLKFTIRDRNTLEDLIELVRQKQVVLYRDVRGRREFITIPGLNVEDTGVNQYLVSFSPNKVYYQEEI